MATLEEIIRQDSLNPPEEGMSELEKLMRADKARMDAVVPRLDRLDQRGSDVPAAPGMEPYGPPMPTLDEKVRALPGINRGVNSSSSDVAKAANAVKISRDIESYPESLYHDEDLESNWRRHSAETTIQNNPEVGRWVEKNSIHSRLAADDYPQLDKVVKSVRQLGAAINNFDLSDGLSYAGKLANRHSEANFRVTERAIKGFQKGFGEKMIFGAENIEKELGLPGWASRPMLAPVIGIESLLRTLGGATVGGFAAIGQTLQEYGLSETAANSLEREAFHLVQSVPFMRPFGSLGWSVRPGWMQGPSIRPLRGGVSMEEWNKSLTKVQVDNFIREGNAATKGNALNSFHSWLDTVTEKYPPRLMSPEAFNDFQAGRTPPTRVDPVADHVSVLKQGVDEARLKKGIEDVQGSKVRDRSPSAFADLIREVDEGKVALPVETILDMYRTSGKKMTAEDGLFGWIPNLRHQLEQATKLGTEIVVPIADYMANVPPELHGKIAHQVRIGNRLNKEEADALKGTKPEDYDVQTYVPERTVAAAAPFVEPDYRGTPVILLGPPPVEPPVPVQQIPPEQLVATIETPGVTVEAAGIKAEVPPTATEVTAPAAPAQPPVDVTATLDPRTEMLMQQTGTRMVQTDINMETLTAYFGTKLYDPAQLTGTTVKETLQNSFDAIKGMIERGEETEGSITITMDEDNRRITIHDDGVGMTPEIMAGPFLTLGSSLKRTDRPSGLFGIAKMLYMHGNESIRVRTMENGIVSELFTTGDQLKAMSSDRTIKAPMDVRNATDQDTKLFPKGHGTRIEIVVPKTFLDPTTGMDQEIGFDPSLYSNPSIQRSPLFMGDGTTAPIEVTFVRTRKDLPDQKDVIKVGKNFPMDKVRPFPRVQFKWGTVDIYMTRSGSVTYGWDNLHFLSNGIWQFSSQLKHIGFNAPKIPNEFWLDVSPHVGPKDAGYPWDMNRMRLAPATEDEFKVLLEYIQKLFESERIAEDVVNMGSFQYLRTGPGGYAPETVRLTPAAPPTATPLSDIMAGATIEIKPGESLPGGDRTEARMFVDGEEVLPITKAEMEAFRAYRPEEMKIEQSQVSPTTPVLHVNVKIIEQEATYGTDAHPEISTPLDAAARAQFGQRFDSFMGAVGQAFIELRDVVAADLAPLEVGKTLSPNERPYTDMMKEATGVSLDVGYRGVNAPLPFSAMYVNPAHAEAAEPVAAAFGIIGTMIHEMAHFKHPNHGLEFRAEMQRILYRLRVLQREGKFDLADYEDRFVKLMEINDDITQFLRDGIRRGKPIGRRIKTPSGEQVSYATRPGGLEGPGDERLRPLYQEAEGEPRPPELPPDLKTEEGLSAVGEAGRAVKRVRKALFIDPLFKTGKGSQPPANVTKADWAIYSRLIEKEKNEIFNRVQKIAHRAIKRDQTAEWKREELEMRGQVEADMRSTEVIAADRFIRYGLKPTGEHLPAPKMDAVKVNAILGQGHAIGDLTVGRGGVDPADIALVIGYNNAADMLEALNEFNRDRGAKRPPTYFNELAVAETIRRMEEKYGNLNENILRQAQEEALGAMEMDILALEIRMAARQIGIDLPIDRKNLVAGAEKMFEKVLVGELSDWSVLERAAGRAANEALSNAIRKKWTESLVAKQQQFNAIAHLKLLTEFQELQAKFQKSVDKLEAATVKGVDQKFLNQIHRILDQVGIGHSHDPADLAEQLAELPHRDLETFAKSYVANGGELAIPAFLYDPMYHRKYNDPNTTLAVRDMTTEQFKDLKDAIDSLENAGRKEKHIEIKDRKEQWEKIKGKLRASIQSLPKREPDVKNKIYQLDAMLARMEVISLDLDIQSPLGPFNTWVFRPITEARQLEERMLKEMAEYIKTMPVDWAWRDTLDTPVANDVLIDPWKEKPYDLTRADMLEIMLNYGTESNIDKLVRHHSRLTRYPEMYQIGEEMSKADAVRMMKAADDAHAEKLRQDLWNWIVKNASEKDWAYVKHTWGAFERLAPEIKVLYRKLTGVAPDMMEGITLNHPVFGDIEGKYFPVIYDKWRSNINVIKQRSVVEGIMDSDYHRATTPNGYVKTRADGFTDYVVVKSSPELIGARLQQTIHDLAFREAVIAAAKIIYDPDIQADFKQHYGIEYMPTVENWLKRVANRGNTLTMRNELLESGLGGLRRNMVINFLGANLSVMAAAETGVPHPLTMATMFNSIEGGESAWARAHRLSGELSNVWQGVDRDIRMQIDKLVQSGRLAEWKANAAYYSMIGTAYATHIFRVQTFINIMDQQVALGIGEKDAAYIADQQVRLRHGASSYVDLPSLFAEQGEAVNTFITLFQTIFNTHLMQMRMGFGAARRIAQGQAIPSGPGQPTGDWRKMGIAFTIAMLLPTIVGAAWMNAKRKDETFAESLAWALPLQILNLTPPTKLLAEGIQAWRTGNIFAGRSPLATAAKSVTDMMQVVATQTGLQRRGGPRQEIQVFMSGVGLLFGYPLHQLGKDVQFFYNAYGRRTDRVRTWEDLWKGVWFGKTNPRE